MNGRKKRPQESSVKGSSIGRAHPSSLIVILRWRLASSKRKVYSSKLLKRLTLMLYRMRIMRNKKV